MPVYGEKDTMVPSELKELSELIKQLPSEYRASFEDAADRAVEGTQRRVRILNFIQEALSQIRLDMKYLMFDLDATRQERDEYRTQLEELRGERYR
ncbi:MAG: transcriptional regulator [Planctomycetia bacterium]|nr:transcriptional regulator [Planctomycetia bacterium]